MSDLHTCRSRMTCKSCYKYVKIHTETSDARRYPLYLLPMDHSLREERRNHLTNLGWQSSKMSPMRQIRQREKVCIFTKNLWQNCEHLSAYSTVEGKSRPCVPMFVLYFCLETHTEGRFVEVGVFFRGHLFNLFSTCASVFEFNVNIQWA